MAKQTVALEVLSYHATAPEEEVQQIMVRTVGCFVCSLREHNPRTLERCQMLIFNDKCRQCSYKITARLRRIVAKKLRAMSVIHSRVPGADPPLAHQ